MLNLRSATRIVSFVLCSLALGTGSAAASWDDGVAAFKQKDYRRAVQRLQLAVRSEPQDARAHYLLGLALAHEGRKREALQELERALDPSMQGLDPSLVVHVREDQRIVRRTRPAKLAERADDLGEEFRDTLDRPTIERPGRPR